MLSVIKCSERDKDQTLGVGGRDGDMGTDLETNEEGRRRSAHRTEE